MIAAGPTPTVDLSTSGSNGHARDPYGSKLGLWIGLIVLFIPLAVYIYCLCPTVFVGDSGDFLTAAFTLGVPHPPGYPLYTMLGHFFMSLPIPGGLSAPAYRMDMMSAICGWAACVFMFLFLRRSLRTQWAALAGALALAFSSQFWQHAEIAEVYTMEVMFVTLIFYLAVLYVQEKRVGWALFLAFIMGLALSHHYVVLIFYPGVLIFIGINGGLKLRWSVWLLAGYLALMGLTPYAYLPIVKYKTPLGSVQFVKSQEEADSLPKDMVAAIETPASYFYNYVSRRFYSFGRKYSLSSAVMPEKTTTAMVFKRFLETAQEDLGVPLLFFGFLGWLAMYFSFRQRRASLGTSAGGNPASTELAEVRAPFLMPALGWVIYFLIVHFYPSGDILAAPLENLAVVVPPLLIPLMTATAAIIALGLDASARWIEAYIRTQGIEDPHTNPKFRTFTALLILTVFALITVNAWKNAETGDKSQSIISYNYALNVLDSCDPGSILLTTGDETFIFWYVQACEPSADPNDPLPGYRKDVWATNWIHNLTTLELLADEPEAMKIVMENFIINSGYYRPDLSNYYGPRPINTTFVASTFADSEMIMSLDVILNGLTYLFRRPGDIPPPDTPGFKHRVDLMNVVEGAGPLLAIDWFDSRPFDTYRWEGLPRFEGTGARIDFEALVKSDYLRVSLEPQEMEVLGRYQDSLYRFGVQALLQDTPESVDEAVSYFLRCVTLDFSGWFGWKELGDSFVRAGQLEPALFAYDWVTVINAEKGDVPPEAEAGARAGISQVKLITGNTALMKGETQTAKSDLGEAQSQAREALLLDQSNQLARAVLAELQKMDLDQLFATQPSPETPEGTTSGTQDELHNLDNPPASSGG